MLANERVRSVFQGRKPDRVPLILDLSHWYRKNCDVPFDLRGFTGVEPGLVDLHKRVGAVCYVEMGAFYSLASDDPSVRIESRTEDGVYSTEVHTPAGSLREERVFNPGSYSYGIRKHLLESTDDFPVVECLMEHLTCTPKWERLEAWRQALGEWAYPYVQLPYSGSGYLISRNFGVEKTVFAALDEPEAVRRLVDAVNACNLRILDTILDGPFETLFLSDNYDSNVQTRAFFDEYVRDYYGEVARRTHAAGKTLAVHVDGESRGALAWLAECGVDCADALTPAPMFAHTPQQMRAEAGEEMILSGGIPATIFGSGTDEQFERSVRDWLQTRETSWRLLLAAGDQVPTEAPYDRIERLCELVERYGQL
jgi:hypothetical protein